VSVVVSDTSPLYYLILCGVDAVLARLFERAIIPPTVFAELQRPNTPAMVQEWMRALPAWVAVQKPSTLDTSLNLDAGELEAICLAREIHAAAVLMDDRAGRLAASQFGSARHWNTGPARAGGAARMDRLTADSRAAATNQCSTRSPVGRDGSRAAQGPLELEAIGSIHSSAPTL